MSLSRWYRHATSADLEKLNGCRLGAQAAGCQDGEQERDEHDQAGDDRAPAAPLRKAGFRAGLDANVDLTGTSWFMTTIDQSPSSTSQVSVSGPEP